MPKPNLLIVGCQKSGTTWLHSCLKKSDHIFGSEVKELNFFNSIDFEDGAADYLTNFPQKDGARYYMESTPHYLQLPAGRIDAARNIADYLDNPKIIVIFRNPTARYESAYVHHIMKGRVDYTPKIEDLTDDSKMLTLGRYAEVLEYWQTIFPNMLVLFHDDMEKDPVAFVQRAMDYLELENDIAPEDLLFRSNDKNIKARKLDLGWPEIPTMSDALRAQLLNYYRDDIVKLEKMTGRDLQQWSQ